MVVVVGDVVVLVVAVDELVVVAATVVVDVFSKIVSGESSFGILVLEEVVLDKVEFSVDSVTSEFTKGEIEVSKITSVAAIMTRVIPIFLLIYFLFSLYILSLY